MIFKKKLHNAKKVVYKGIKFDSNLEKDRYIILLMHERKGLIKDIKLQTPFEIIPKQEKGDNRITSLGKNKTIRKTVYKSDFTYTICKTNQKIINDVKGRAMEVYKLKLKLIIQQYCTNNEWLFLESYKENIYEI